MKEERSLGRFLVLAVLVVLTAAGLLGFLVMEVIGGYPVAWRFYVVFGSLWMSLLLLFIRFRIRAFHAGLLTAMFAVLFLLYSLPWSTRKPFLRQFERIEVGMTEQEVERIMTGYQYHSSGNKWIFRPRPSRRFDSDWGEVYFDGQTVRRTFFSPD